MAPPLRLQPALMEEIVEEILLRFPPDDPASLVRAALACKRWCGLISGNVFRRRYRKLHRAPPLLGFIYNVDWSLNQPKNARFVPTSSRLSRVARPEWGALDARHGRVLLIQCPRKEDDNDYLGLNAFAIWNPITREQQELPLLPLERRNQFPFSFNAAMLCARGGGTCDHLDCHSGPFLVVFVGMYPDGMVSFVYSSEAGAWGQPTRAAYPHDNIETVPGVLVGNAVYFMLEMTTRILKYDLGTREMSIIHMPRTAYGRIVLMTTDNGGLGFARAEKYRLYHWSIEAAGPQGDAVWTQSRVIELETLLPADALLTSPGVVGFGDDLGVIFLGTDDGFFTIDPKSNRVRKEGEGVVAKKDHAHMDESYGFYIVAPYTSFYFPALGEVSTR